MLAQPLTEEGAPKPQGPYSSAYGRGIFLFISGQGPVGCRDGGDAGRGQRAGADATGVASFADDSAGRRRGPGRCCEVLRVSGRCQGLLRVAMRCTRKCFGATKPARTTVGSGMVAPGMKVEIDCIAYLPQRG